MIQTLGDVFLLVSIVSVGLVAFLLAIFLYNLIFVVMDLRQVMKRLNDITAEVEEMIMAPVQMVSKVVEWIQKWVWDSYVTEKTKKKAVGKRKKKPPGKKKEFRNKKV